MKLTEQKFNEVLSYLLRSSTEYHNPGKYNFYGIVFDKEKRAALVITPVFVIEVNNIDMGNFVPDDKPFFNCIFKEFTELKYPVNPELEKLAKEGKESITTRKIIDELLAEMGEFNFVGKTVYSITNILDIMQRAKKEVMIDESTRYVFSQGFLPPDTAAIKFSKGTDGKPFFSLKGVDKEFKVSQYSTVPFDIIEAGETYACAVNDMESYFSLDVITKFGKTRSGLIISDGIFEKENIPKINNFEGVPVDLMTCSNVLDMQPNQIMSPIHIDGLILYDVMRVFLMCKNPLVELHFQKSSDDFLMFSSIPVDDDDVYIRAYMGPLRQNYGCQRR